MTIDLAIQAITFLVAFGAFGGVFKYRMDQHEKRVASVDGALVAQGKDIVEIQRGLALVEGNLKDKTERIFSLESSRTFNEDRVATMHGEIKVLKSQDDHLDKRLDGLSSELKAAEQRIISRIDQLANGRDRS